MHVMEGEGTCCRMWITHLEIMEKKNVMQGSPKENRGKNEKKNTNYERGK